MLAAASWDPITIWTAVLVIFTFPSGYLAWVTVADRKDRKKRQAERSEEHRLYEQIGIWFWGSDRSKWPKPGETNVKPVVPLVEAINRQVNPRNGKTLAVTAEETRDILEVHSAQILAKLDDQKEVVDDLLEGMAKISVLVAEHVSDGHGGQKSW